MTFSRTKHYLSVLSLLQCRLLIGCWREREREIGTEAAVPLGARERERGVLVRRCVRTYLVGLLLLCTVLLSLSQGTASIRHSGPARPLITHWHWWQRAFSTNWSPWALKHPGFDAWAMLMHRLVICCVGLPAPPPPLHCQGYSCTEAVALLPGLCKKFPQLTHGRFHF